MEAITERIEQLKQMNKHNLTHINDLLSNLTNEKIKQKYNEKQRNQTYEDYENFYLNNIEHKIKRLNTQFEKKCCLVRVVKTFDFSALNCPNWMGDNLFVLENIKNFDWQHKQYLEELFTDEKRIYFDIDIKHETQINQIENFEQILNNLSTYMNDIEFYGIIEKATGIIFDESLFSPYDKIKIFEHEHLNEGKKPKLISMHIYANYYGLSENINNIMLYYKNRYFKDETDSIFDMSVYTKSGKRQAFRMSYSAKVQSNPITKEITDYRPPNEKIKYDDIKDLILNLRCSRRETDKELPAEFLEMVNDELKEQEQEQAKTKKLTLTTFKNNSQNQIIEYSIFEYVKHPETDEIVKINSLVPDLNHWEISQRLLSFSRCVLKLNELEHEINLIDWPVNETYNEEDNIKFNEDILKCLNYNRNKENIKPLFTIKKYAFRYEEQLKEQLKQKLISQEQYKTEMKIFKNVVDKINGYIKKYLNLSFIHHNQHYDIIKTITDPLTGRADFITKLLYNVFKDINDNYYYCFNNNVKQIKIFNQKQFLNYFKLKPEDLKIVFPMVATFEDIREYKTAKSKIAYKEDKINIDNNVLKLLDLLKLTFAFEDDFKFYVGFLSGKVKNTYETLNKSIISQPLSEEAGSGKDALKTYITDLLKSFIDIHKAEQSNFNKSLNGAYLDGNLCVIEEMPKEITNVNEFVLRLKNYTATDEIESEKKAQNAIKIQNKIDFIINSNHILKELFYNKNECEPMIKRFKILSRISINPKEHAEILDYFHNEDKDLSHAYGFYNYLLNDTEYFNYFQEHKKDINEIEQKYLNSAIEEGTSDKIETLLNIDDFVKSFKSRFVDKNKCLRAKQITDYFKEKIQSMKTINQKTLIYNFSCCDLITKEGKYNKIDDEQIKKIYNKYFEFYEDNEDNKDNKDNKDNEEF